MSESLIVVSVIALVLGVLLSFIDYFKAYNKIKINNSLMAGISIAYFFFVVLPEISENIPEFPLHLSAFEYLFVLIGFSVNHVVEKFMLQKVEAKSQKRVRELIEMERNLELVEDHMEDTIDNELIKGDLDIDALRELAQTVSRLKVQESDMKKQIDEAEQLIKLHLSKDLEQLRFFSQFTYHALIGLLIVNVLTVDIVSGILLFIFAFFMAIIMNREGTEVVYSDLDLCVEFKETKSKRILLALAGLIGVILGISFEVIFPLNLEFVYLLYSFVCGVIMYTIIRDLIPEKEKGNPKLYLVGIGIMAIFVFLVKRLEHGF